MNLNAGDYYKVTGEVPKGATAVLSPTNHNDVVGYHHYATPDDMRKALDEAEAGFEAWLNACKRTR